MLRRKDGADPLPVLPTHHCAKDGRKGFSSSSSSTSSSPPAIPPRLPEECRRCRRHRACGCCCCAPFRGLVGCCCPDPPRTPRRCGALLAASVLLVYLLAVRGGLWGVGRRWVMGGLPALTRPLWDTPLSLPWSTVYTNVGYTNASSCALYEGWSARPLEEQRALQIFDCVIFSTELDLLEVRLHELYGVVDRFIVVESVRTHTHRRKPLVLAQALARNDPRFAPYRDKIVHLAVTDALIAACEKEDRCDIQNPYSIEALQRRTMFDGLQNNGLKAGDVLLVSDLDEIPRRDVARLMRGCKGQPTHVQLELKEYTYSFEFKTGDVKTNSAARTYQVSNTDDATGKYIDWIGHHTTQGTAILSDAGWHCTWCFRTLEQFTFKMKGYVHFDRAADPR